MFVTPLLRSAGAAGPSRSALPASHVFRHLATSSSSSAPLTRRRAEIALLLADRHFSSSRSIRKDEHDAAEKQKDGKKEKRKEEDEDEGVMTLGEFFGGSGVKKRSGKNKEPSSSTNAPKNERQPQSLSEVFNRLRSDGQKTDKKTSGNNPNTGSGGSSGGSSSSSPEPNAALILLSVGLWVAYQTFSGGMSGKEITWQEFRTAFLDKGLVDKLEVINRSRVKVSLHSNATGQMYPNGSPPGGGAVSYYFSIGSVEAFERKLDEAQQELGIPTHERVPVSYHERTSLGSVLWSFAPTLLVVGVLYYMGRRASGMGAGGGGGGPGGIFSIGKSKAKMFNHETDIKTKFKDVAGMDEAKEEVMEFVNFLKEPQKCASCSRSLDPLHGAHSLCLRLHRRTTRR